MGAIPDRTTTRFIFLFLLAAGVVVLGFAWLTAQKEARPQSIAYRNIYDTDRPPHAQTPFDPRLLLLDPYECAKAPIADTFSSPLGLNNGSFTYDAQPWGTQNAKRGGPHWGMDLNGIGGGNSDLGDPVYAAGRGRVIYLGSPSPQWGNVVVLLHRLPNGTLLQTLYAHLDEILVRRGDTIPRGKLIGRVGNAQGRYQAHLHFEAIPSLALEAGMPAYGASMGGRIDPQTLFSNEDKTLIPDPLPLIEAMQQEIDLNNMHIYIDQDAATQSPVGNTP